MFWAAYERSRMIGNRGNGVTGEARVGRADEVSGRRRRRHSKSTECCRTNFVPSGAVEPTCGIRRRPNRQHKGRGQRFLSRAEPVQECRSQLDIRLNPGLRIGSGAPECFHYRPERIPARMLARGDAAHAAGWKLFAGYDAIVAATQLPPIPPAKGIVPRAKFARLRVPFGGKAKTLLQNSRNPARFRKMCRENRPNPGHSSVQSRSRGQSSETTQQRSNPRRWRRRYTRMLLNEDALGWASRLRKRGRFARNDYRPRARTAQAKGSTPAGEK